MASGHKPSLTKDEVDQLKRKVAGTQSALCQTVAKLYLSPKDGGSGEWRDTGVWGATCVVTDRAAKALLIQIWDLRTWELKFLHEVYDMMPYQAPNPQFHTFEIEHGMVGLSFCDSVEADVFRSKINSLMPGKQAALAAAAASPSTQGKKSGGGLLSRLFGRKEKPKELSSIGTPTNVVHKQHIGYDPGKGFECADIPDQWKSIFRNAGVKKKDLQNPESAKVIYETLQQQLGGELPPGMPGLPPDMMMSSAAPKPAAHVASRSASAAPTAPAASTSSASTASTAPEAPPMSVPAAPDMGAPTAPPFEAPPFDAPPFEAPPFDAPAIDDAPPMGGPPAPGPPSTGSTSRSSGISAGALSLGASGLKKSTPAPVASSSSSSSGGGHLDAIRAGVRLKKTAAPEHKSALPDIASLDAKETNSLMGALQSAMASRLSALKGSGDGDSGADDWSDDD